MFRNNKRKFYLNAILCFKTWSNSRNSINHSESQLNFNLPSTFTKSKISRHLTSFILLILHIKKLNHTSILWFKSFYCVKHLLIIFFIKKTTKEKISKKNQQLNPHKIKFWPKSFSKVLDLSEMVYYLIRFLNLLKSNNRKDQ